MVIRNNQNRIINAFLDPVSFKKTKHILRAAYELRDRVSRDLFTPRFVPGDQQLADIMTKALGPSPHMAQLRRVLVDGKATGVVDAH